MRGELDDPSLVEQGSDIGRQEHTSILRTSGFESVHHSWTERIPLGKHSLIFTCDTHPLEKSSKQRRTPGILLTIIDARYG